MLLIIHLLFVSVYSLNSHACDKKEIVARELVIFENLKAQALQISNILEGQTPEGFSLQSIFGLDFKVEKTPQRIKQIEETLNQNEGISIENISFSKCLISLSLNEIYTKLVLESKKLLKLKIKLLKKNQELGDSLRVSGIAEGSLPDIKSEIDKDSSNTLQEKKNLENVLIKNLTESSEHKSSVSREFLDHENELTKIKIQLLSLKLGINESLENKIKKFEKSTEELKRLTGHIDSKNKSKLKKNFKKVETLWLSLSSENFYDVFGGGVNLKLPIIPNVIDSNKFKENTKRISKLHDEVTAQRKEIIRNYAEKKNQELKLLNHLVSSSSAIREKYYKSLGKRFFFESIFSLEFVMLVKNEVVSAPYRIISFFYSKFLYVEEKISIGKEGFVELFGVFLKFVTLIGIFLGLKFGFTRFNKAVDSGFKYLFKNKNRSIFLKRSFSFWAKIKDSSVHVLWLLTIGLLRTLFDLDEFYFGLEVFKVYLISQILKSFLTVFLGAVSRIDMSSFNDFKIKANETSNKFKNIFLFYCYTMIFIEASVGKVYLFTLINYFVLLYSLYHFVKENSRWESEFKKYAEKKFSGVIVEKYIEIISVVPKYFRSSFLFVFILLLMVFDFFIGITENFEVSKKISAKLFKKQIEKIEAEEGADSRIPQSYKDEFSFKSLDCDEGYVSNAHGIEEKIIREINEWTTEKSEEHSLVIYGDKGIGKTTLLKNVFSKAKIGQILDVKHVKMPSKTTTEGELFKFINTIFSEEESSEEFNIYNYDKALVRKTIVVVDEAQNVFLSKTGGFEAYYALVNLINLNTENIFWVMSFNKYSWLYLDRAFGRTQFFRNVFELTGWNDVKIKELIMNRHYKSSFKLSYDLLISATRSQDEIDKYASVESKFFKLLWELSRGNPRTALFLWMSALSRKNVNTFNVNIPRDIDFNGLEKTPDELMFVISHVLKHENLTTMEIEQTTNLERGLVRNAIRQGIEKKFFYKDTRGRYMVEISTQYGLIRFLKVKNFIYGS